MNASSIRTVAMTLLLVASSGCDQSPPPAGFAGLGGQPGDFAQVSPGKVFQFPADHGAHPDFRIEWWYLTANLEDDQGQRRRLDEVLGNGYAVLGYRVNPREHLSEAMAEYWTRWDTRFIQVNRSRSGVGGRRRPRRTRTHGGDPLSR